MNTAVGLTEFTEKTEPKQLGGAGKAYWALVGGETSGNGVVETSGEGVALIYGVIGGVDRIEEFDANDAGLDGELSLFHDAVSARASHRYDEYTCFDRHDRRALFKLLQAAVVTAGTLRIDQK